LSFEILYCTSIKIKNEPENDEPNYDNIQSSCPHLKGVSLSLTGKTFFKGLLIFTFFNNDVFLRLFDFMYVYKLEVYRYFESFQHQTINLTGESHESNTIIPDSDVTESESTSVPRTRIYMQTMATCRCVMYGVDYMTVIYLVEAVTSIRIRIRI
jgi:hypothetical protein